ncbi:uncharacterized protein HMPREF1120_08225 [Exophiala dermatitidis NIH/UT8656]|uniref:DNA 3'-5' helicase n=1 Tax=Exophiala dermatitidis (strain ATCC 34100 / CBS 525.76 / NIH/UT8656) TaxID=858893 RepID=H6C830_EXODN|nr:uncharacterized protein HMPREF1120_08225 [Exophiala dermatitidis NIH/UT8656]EHY60257.1 hypothetical protein HMPREF1120_08225 [Exophiala dermatitidis NIH/UT8656]
MLGTDGHTVSSFFHPSSSSPAHPATSPTISALQNHRTNRTKSSNAYTANVPDLTPRMGIGRPRPNTMMSLASAPPVVQGIQLVPATALPDKLRSVVKFDVFNAIQSKCFSPAFETDDNMVVSAPTGSGKTVIMELAICRLIAQCHGGDFKVVYQAPTKSLCSERYQDWHARFGVLNLQCAELTGDTDFNNLRNVQSAHIILTTPEKWDSVTRKWKDHAKLMQLVKLFLVDEVHILKENRGATLEAVISRMKTASSDVRFIALSATVPNSEDIAAWLGKSPASQNLPAHREVFGESFRPVVLKKYVYGFEARCNDFAFETVLNKQIPGVISKHGQGKPIMIFCPTRKGSMATAKMLADLWTSSHPSQRLWSGPEKLSPFSNSDLKVISSAGVAFHHGGLSVEDRRGVEQDFLHGQINIICCTSTLAVGVNLPCYLVILKGTTAWIANMYQEYADLEVMQMLGRAGRPQFETSACAVILTRQNKVSHYERMTSGEEVLESCLHQNLIEHLNAEICLGTVQDMGTAKKWLASTFLYIRMQKNPSHYRFKEGIDQVANEDEMLEQLCKKDISLLHDAGIINIHPHFSSTEYGQAMARYYVSFETMKSFMALPPKAKTSEILSILAQAREFRDVRMQAGEKSFYKEINQAPEIRFPIKVDVAQQAHKVSLLIQAELGSITSPDGDINRKHHQQHRHDISVVFAHANRLIRCLIDCQVHMKDAVSARHALELGRSLAAHVWDNTASQLRQIEGLGEVAVRKLASATINSIDTLINTEPSRLELVLGKNPPFGRDLLKKLETFPNLRVSVKETGRELRAGWGVTISFMAELGFLNVRPPKPTKKHQQLSVCFLTETSNGDLVDYRMFAARSLANGGEIPLTVLLTKPTTHLTCYVMCAEVAGTSKYAELRLSGIPASIYPSLQPGSVDTGLTNHKDGSLEDAAWDDEFDDGGVNDQDLLSVEARGDEIEVIEDIDALLEEQSQKNRFDNSKESSTSPRKPREEHDEDADVTVYKEPTRLRNGRWTCQHDCRERNRKCKHKCCAEGVAKPRRRAKGESKSHVEQKVQTKLTSATTRDSKTATVTRIPRTTGHSRQPEQPKPRVASEVISMPARRRSKEPPSKRRKISTDQKLEDAFLEPSNGTRQDDSTSECNPVVDSSHNEESLSGGPDATFKKTDADLFDFGSDVADEVRANQSTLDKIDVVNEENPALPNPVGGDWLDEYPFSAFSTSDFDLGGFEPPLEHVAMSDVIKPHQGLFVTGLSSSPVKSPIHCAEQLNQGSDHLDAMADHEPVASGSVQEKADVASLVPQHKEPTESDINTPTETNPKTPEAVELTTTTADDHSIPIALEEDQAERERRLYEEDQKKKWEGIDEWIYDAFHEYVELI